MAGPTNKGKNDFIFAMEIGFGSKTIELFQSKSDQLNKT